MSRQVDKRRFVIEWEEITNSYADSVYEGVQYIEVTRGGLPSRTRVHSRPTEASQKRIVRLMQAHPDVKYGEREWDSAGDELLVRWWEFNPGWYSR